ncbi:EAL domain-containing protein [Shewanella sp. SM34]|uniref:bifunctional diguanylate cyclase/phosphodiesterase n=1 Tax=unclassified Shewanella TaxID=196818 RepID=UPI0021DB4CCB|nr:MULTISPECIES: GGDEF domain-containing phosphodiesterase [unclassified Shewanella]MCU8057566.1 EAL domain-containing protein [Shewanella sp. SM35]MCU8066460.1 EAL domain-containing protein [Shewanella sp. SM34]
MLNSFRARLILVFFIVLTLVQFATAFSVLTATEKDNFLQQQKSLDIGANVFLEVLSNRGIQLSQSLSVLSADFGFKRAIATGEQETIESVLSNHGSRIGADAAVLLSPKGDLLTSSLPGLTQDDIQSLFNMTTSNHNALAILNFDHASYQFVLQPVKAPTLIAWVGMGFLLDEKVAQQAKAITGIDVSFVNQATGRTEIASTLSDNEKLSVIEQASLLPSLLKMPSESIPVDHLSMGIKLYDHNGSQLALLHQSNLKWQQSYQQLRNNMLLIFALTLALAIAIAIWLSGSLTEPVHQLVNYARKIGQGKQPANIQGAPAELRVLAKSLSLMRDDIEAREKDLVYQSRHDSLTGLLNRFAAKQHLADLNDKLSGAMVLLDIKHFRHINDIIGFANADTLLLLFARRLEQLAPTPDLLARLDGDSFLLLYSQGIRPEHLLKSLDMLESPFPIQGSNISLTVRAGLLEIDGNGADIDVLVRRAEIALNQACLEEQRIVSYRQGADEKYQRELTIIRDLPIGLAQNQLYLVFQPKVDLRLNQCTGAEALIRWQHPTLGFIPPDEFIQLAENSGNIDIVSQWVLKQAIQQLVTWQRRGMVLKLAINLSAHDLVDTRLPNQIAILLKDNNLPSGALCIEVTEGAVMKDAQTVVSVLQRFRDMGVSVAIDDFGTGHSSLAYLKILPVNEVKIDRSFIKDMLTDSQDVMIVDTSIKLIHGLGFTVVAEGVEEREGVDILRKLNCDIIQGYVFSKPLKAADFDIWFEDFNRHNSLSTEAVLRTLT